MIGIDVVAPAQAPATDRDERPLTAVTYPVPCEQCGRIVRVAMNALRPPGFHRLDEQVACPEIQERRSRGDGGLLLMMCGPLKQSLAARCDAAEVEATAPGGGQAGRVVCSIPGVSIAQYAPNEARSRAEIWQAHGYDRLATRLRAAVARAERRPLVWTRTAAAGLGALLLAAAASWFMLAREPAAPPPTQPQAAEASVAASSRASVESSVRVVTAEAMSAATAPAPAPLPNAPSDTATLSRSTETAPLEAPALLASASAATAPETAPAAESTATPGPAEAAAIRLPDMVTIPGGAFAMGGVESSELPVHRVTIKPFALGKYPVTIGEWKACVADGACADVMSGPDDNPVTNVGYDDVRGYLAWLSRAVGKPFRLPTEAEWEYAARGGATTAFWWGDRMRSGMANCNGCNEPGAPAQLMKVGSFAANPFGLFDMGGSVDQWVADSWHKSYQGAPSDGSAWIDEQSFVHVIRSGSWKKDASYARSGSRDRYDGRVRYPTHGFRLALSL
ncbi:MULTISPECIES: formylglycine-generating enzyme family protein [unclassified Bradyrhizobium]|uniref:formylglycine-generating enzyme family protein n=1 Tax=unclassified Bradyrhizobium TaxID=2631580 RepID=UPI002915F66D|nr:MULTISPECIES: formylglycine-generating enzyme family protein [unclassified Bradyrhizobium]